MMGRPWWRALVGWRARRQAQRQARYRALRHLAVVAQAVYSGSTAAYDLTPGLPRAEGSTEIGWDA